QIGGDHRVILGEVRDQLTPRVRAVADTVDEQQRRTLTDVDERALIAMDRPVLHLVIDPAQSLEDVGSRQAAHATNLPRYSRLRATKLSSSSLLIWKPSRAGGRYTPQVR